MKTTTKNYKLTETGKAEVLSINTCTICGKDIMKLIGIVFTRLGGRSRLAFVYRCQDGSIKTIPAAICRKGEQQ